MALDEATTAFLAAGAEQGGPALHEMTPQQAREMNGGLTALYGPGPDMTVTDSTIPGPDGHQVPVRTYLPADQTKGVIVYAHGGGWMVGDLDGFDTLCRIMAERTGCAVLSVDYRLAPEHAFPAAADDTWAAVQWAADHRAELNAAADAPLLVSGDSSGGNVAAVAAQRAVRNGGPELAAQLLVYPVTDANFETGSYNDPQNNTMLGKEAMVMFWDAYTPDPADRKNPDSAPLQGDPTGTAPALVLLAEHDVLRDEGAAYAEKLRQSGVEVDEQVIEGQMHGYFTFVNVLPGAATGMDAVASYVAKITG